MYIFLLCGWIKEVACTLRKQHASLPENSALNRCEACFNWVWTVQLTQHCLYMDSPGYMKHSYMTWNLCMKQQDKGKKRLAYSSYSPQLNHKQICWWRYTMDFETNFHFDYMQPRRDQQGSKYAWTNTKLSTSDLGTHVCMHVTLSNDVTRCTPT